MFSVYCSVVLLCVGVNVSFATFAPDPKDWIDLMTLPSTAFLTDPLRCLKYTQNLYVQGFETCLMHCVKFSDDVQWAVL